MPAIPRRGVFFVLPHQKNLVHSAINAVFSMSVFSMKEKLFAGAGIL